MMGQPGPMMMVPGPMGPMGPMGPGGPMMQQQQPKVNWNARPKKRGAGGKGKGKGGPAAGAGGGAAGGKGGPKNKKQMNRNVIMNY